MQPNGVVPAHVLAVLSQHVSSFLNGRLPHGLSLVGDVDVVLVVRGGTPVGRARLPPPGEDVPGEGLAVLAARLLADLQDIVSEARREPWPATVPFVPMHPRATVGQDGLRMSYSSADEMTTIDFPLLPLPSPPRTLPAG